MADKKKKKEEGLLTEAAEAIGTVVGKVAAAVGVKNTPPTNIKIPKLAKTGKSRLPRKLKKLNKKKAAAAK
jgi:hypothetical protein